MTNTSKNIDLEHWLQRASIDEVAGAVELCVSAYLHKIGQDADHFPEVLSSAHVSLAISASRANARTGVIASYKIAAQSIYDKAAVEAVSLRGNWEEYKRRREFVAKAQQPLLFSPKTVPVKPPPTFAKPIADDDEIPF